MNKRATDVHSTTTWVYPFTRPVCLHAQGTWVIVESAEQALACLHGCFSDQSGPSYLRATWTCSVVMAGKLTPEAAQAAFVVAAMEAGFAFDVLEEHGLALERQAEAAAEKGLEEFLLSEAAE